MLLEIFVTIPSLVLAEIAWFLRFAVALTCLLVLFAAAVGIIGLRWNSDQRRQFVPSTVTNYRELQACNRSTKPVSESH